MPRIGQGDPLRESSNYLNLRGVFGDGQEPCIPKSPDRWEGRRDGALGPCPAPLKQSSALENRWFMALYLFRVTFFPPAVTHSTVERRCRGDQDGRSSELLGSVEKELLCQRHKWLAMLRMRMPQEKGLLLFLLQTKSPSEGFPQWPSATSVFSFPPDLLHHMLIQSLGQDSDRVALSYFMPF